MSFGANIRKYRTELKLTQAELAKKAGVLPHHVNRWENDKVIPTIEHLKKLSQVLNITIDGLLFTNKERKRVQVSDKELLDKIKDVDKLTPEDRTTIVNLIDTLKGKSGK